MTGIRVTGIAGFIGSTLARRLRAVATECAHGARDHAVAGRTVL
jgi:nucleoside-diphosphate-sugar epimerase